MLILSHLIWFLLLHLQKVTFSVYTIQYTYILKGIEQTRAMIIKLYKQTYVLYFMHIIHYTKNKVIVSVINILRFLFATQVGLIQENDELLIKLYGSLSYYYYVF